MESAAASASSSGETVSRLRVMISRTGVRSGSSPEATHRRMMSRSVTMPRSFFSGVQTGRAPISGGIEDARREIRFHGRDGNDVLVHQLAYLHT
jgi:hypothetical protein